MSLSKTAYEVLRRGVVKPLALSTRDSGVEIESRAVQHAIDASGFAALIVPLSDGEPDISDTNSKGLRLDTHHMPTSNGSTRFGILRCEDSGVDRQFALLIDDVLRALDSRTVSPGRTVIVVLERWRSLFGPALTHLLGPNAQAGLLAELHLLEAMGRTGMSSLEGWTGPSGGRHDFSGPHAAIEVKATTSRDQFTVSIHGAKQLDDPAHGSLYLYAEQLERSPQGESVADVANRIVTEELFPAPQFLESLKLVGFSLDDEEAYAPFRFSVLRTRVCRVDDEFPRIVRTTFAREDLIDRIFRLQYSIDLAAVAEAAPDSSALSFVVEELMK